MELPITKCPHCGYERTKNDDNFVSSKECPKCGIFYKKWKPSSISNSTEPILTSSEASNINKEKKSIRYKSIILAATIFIVLAIFAKFTFFSRIESTLPAISPIGMESSSYLIHASGSEKTITAAGQIFTPPLQTPVLFKLGFMFTQYSVTKQVPDFKLQVRLSEWDGDHPGPTAIWVSEPRAIPSTTDDFQADWVDFNVPNISLDPAKQYVAWVTLSGLGNPSDASIGIPRMGPRYSTSPSDSEREQGSGRSPYPEGMSALYKQENPDGDVSLMINSHWDVHDVGQNLHVRMSFENNRIVFCGITLFINSKYKHDNKEISHTHIVTNTENEKQQEENERRRIELEQQREKQVEREERRKQEWEESEQQRIETEQQQKQQREETEQKRRQQQVEAEIQQYEREKQQEEMKQKQDEIRQQQGDRWNREPRRVQRIPRRR